MGCLRDQQQSLNTVFSSNPAPFWKPAPIFLENNLIQVGRGCQPAGAGELCGALRLAMRLRDCERRQVRARTRVARSQPHAVASACLWWADEGCPGGARTRVRAACCAVTPTATAQMVALECVQQGGLEAADLRTDRHPPSRCAAATSVGRGGR